MAELGLAEVIQALRAELEDAVTAGEGEQIQFQVKALDVEFQVGVTRATEGKAGVKFWVFEVGGGASRSSESIQTVKLSLAPLSQGREGVKIAGGSNTNPLEGKN